MDERAKLRKERDQARREIRDYGFLLCFLIAIVIVAWAEAYRSNDPWVGMWSLSVVLFVVAVLLALRRSDSKRRLAYMEKIAAMEADPTTTGSGSVRKNADP